MSIINIVYAHTRRSGHAEHKGDHSIILSALPIDDCDMYVYQDAFSYFGELPGIEVLLMLEPYVVLPGEYCEETWRYFDYVLTFLDGLPEKGGKFRKIHFPVFPIYDERGNGQCMQLSDAARHQQERRHAICMINGNKSSTIEGELYSKRIEIAQWFHDHSAIPFDVYGIPPFNLPNYKGKEKNKFETMSQYKYYLCFENVYHPQWSKGYISEKLLHCLVTETVPIYLGCYNIEEYVPEGCFIDFRRFSGYAELDELLSSLTAEKYNAYVENMRSFVRAGHLDNYSNDRLYDTLVDLIHPGWASGHLKNQRWEPGLTPRHARKKLSIINRSPIWSWQDLSATEVSSEERVIPTTSVASGKPPATSAVEDGLLHQHRKNITSQHGEDGIIEHIFNTIGERSRWCVEFGAWDGRHLSNTWALINNKKWSAVLIEGDAQRAGDLASYYSGNPNVVCKQAWISDEAPLDDILAQTPVPKEFDLLSVDIDGDDYWVWKASELYRPRVVIIETNPTFGWDIHFVQKKGGHIGASMRAMVDLAQSKGYELLAYTNINCIFVLREEFGQFGISDNSCRALFSSPYVPRVAADLDGNHYLLQPGPWGFNKLMTIDDLRSRAFAGPMLKS